MIKNKRKLMICPKCKSKNIIRVGPLVDAENVHILDDRFKCSKCNFGSHLSSDFLRGEFYKRVREENKKDIIEDKKWGRLPRNLPKILITVGILSVIFGLYGVRSNIFLIALSFGVGLLILIAGLLLQWGYHSHKIK